MGRRGPKPKLNMKNVLAAIPDTGGIFTEIAKKLRVSRQTAVIFFKDNPDAEKARLEEEEAWLDLAESKLLVSIKAGEYGPVSFFLRTKGRRRGYVEKTEIGGVKDEPIGIAVFPVGLVPSQIDFKDKKLLEEKALSLIDDAITIEAEEVVVEASQLASEEASNKQS